VAGLGERGGQLHVLVVHLGDVLRAEGEHAGHEADEVVHLLDDLLVVGLGEEGVAALGEDQLLLHRSHALEVHALVLRHLLARVEPHLE